MFSVFFLFLCRARIYWNLFQLCAKKQQRSLVDGLAMPAASQAKQPLYPIMCWCQMFAWNGWSPLGTRHRHRCCRRRHRPLLRRTQVLYQTYARTVYKPSSWDLTTPNDFESTLGNEKVKTTRASRKVNEKIVKKKCRLETAATVLFRVVLALSGKCFIMVCAFIPETKIML